MCSFNEFDLYTNILHIYIYSIRRIMSNYIKLNKVNLSSPIPRMNPDKKVEQIEEIKIHKIRITLTSRNVKNLEKVQHFLYHISFEIYVHYHVALFLYLCHHISITQSPPLSLCLSISITPCLLLNLYLYYLYQSNLLLSTNT